MITVSDGATSAPIEFAGVERSVPGLFNDREFTGRVDVQLTNKDRVGARYIFQQNILTGATGRFAAGAWVDIPARDQQIALDWTRTFSNQLVNQLRYSFSRAGFGFEGGSFPTCTRANIFACPTGITLQSGVAFGIQNNLPQGRIINNTQVQDNASLTRGRHTFKFGGDILHVQLFQPTNTSKNGGFTYSGKLTGVSTTNALADLLAGYPATSVLMSGGATNHILQTNYAGFAQGLVVGGNNAYTDGGPQSYTQNLVGFLVTVKL